MSHHNSNNNLETKEKAESIPSVTAEQPVHPFLSKDDIKLLSIMKPFLSTNGQKMIGFFLSFGNETAGDSFPDLSNLLRQAMNKGDTGPLQELLPVLLSSIAGNSNKGGLNPALLTTMLSMLNAKKDS